MADNSTCRKMTTLWNRDLFKLEMLKSVESQQKIKQNSAQLLAYVRYKCGALATGETTRLTADFRCIHLSKLSRSLFLIPGALPASTFCVQLVGDLEEARCSCGLGLRAIPTNSVCSMLLSDFPRRSQTPKDSLWHGPVVNAERLEHSECTQIPCYPRTQVQNSACMARDTRITYNPRVPLLVL